MADIVDECAHFLRVAGKRCERYAVLGDKIGKATRPGQARLVSSLLQPNGKGNKGLYITSEPYVRIVIFTKAVASCRWQARAATSSEHDSRRSRAHMAIHYAVMRRSVDERRNE